MTNDAPVDQQQDNSATSTNDQGENQESSNVDTTETVDEANTESSESDTHDTPKEGNESVDQNMPADVTDREKSAIRKMHEATQETAKYKKEADAFQELLNHPEFNEFLQWQKTKKQESTQPQQAPQVELTEDDLLAAQADPTKFNELISKQINSVLNPVIQQAMKKINSVERDNMVSKQEREIDAFASQHSDFWDIDQRIMKAAINETRGQGLDAAYKMAKQLEKQYIDKANVSIQKKVKEKKNASSASPSKAIDPKIIYANNDSEANKIAFDNAKLGKRVDVRVKKQKS